MPLIDQNGDTLTVEADGKPTMVVVLQNTADGNHAKIASGTAFMNLEKWDFSEFTDDYIDMICASQAGIVNILMRGEIPKEPAMQIARALLVSAVYRVMRNQHENEGCADPIAETNEDFLTLLRCAVDQINEGKPLA